MRTFGTFVCGFLLVFVAFAEEKPVNTTFDNRTQHSVWGGPYDDETDSSEDSEWIEPEPLAPYPFEYMNCPPTRRALYHTVEQLLMHVFKNIDTGLGHNRDVFGRQLDLDVFEHNAAHIMASLDTYAYRFCQGGWLGDCSEYCVQQSVAEAVEHPDFTLYVTDGTFFRLATHLLDYCSLRARRIQLIRPVGLPAEFENGTMKGDELEFAARQTFSQSISEAIRQAFNPQKSTTQRAHTQYQTRNAMQILVLSSYALLMSSLNATHTPIPVDAHTLYGANYVAAMILGVSMPGTLPGERAVTDNQSLEQFDQDYARDTNQNTILIPRPADSTSPDEDFAFRALLWKRYHETRRQVQALYNHTREKIEERRRETARASAIVRGWVYAMAVRMQQYLDLYYPDLLKPDGDGNDNSETGNNSETDIPDDGGRNATDITPRAGEQIVKSVHDLFHECRPIGFMYDADNMGDSTTGGISSSWWWEWVWNNVPLPRHMRYTNTDKKTPPKLKSASHFRPDSDFMSHPDLNSNPDFLNDGKFVWE
eukprot:GDKI01008877.1.p1 GENE.GDKI01008877.1~~GDKI01008877.1.p1  ORF type:complete len:565 (-),score=77.97 GDKI01008877.1:50-1660(-)